MSDRGGFYYLHTDGDLIYKPARVVEFDASYFASPFVLRVWRFALEDRGDAWTILLEGLALGAREERVRKLADTWHCTGEDLIEYMMRAQPSPLRKQGIALFVTRILDHADFEAFVKHHEPAS